MLDIRLRAAAAIITAFAMCVPLFVVCFIGDPRYPATSGELGFSSAAFLPALAILLATPWRKTQIAMLLLLTMIFFLALFEGIKPTSQLNHEGSDLAFLFLHVMHFLLTLVILVLLCGWRAIKRIRRVPY
ncbi:hypothetical protein [Halopseudomonas pelagia]|uniref:hypothetical protein n=1 Tax=Halopseudomonas pelagia TaxID=553151 RepID=UPI00117A5BF7|nr:hypothetical protein [Halopseudomonas pelagia]